MPKSGRERKLLRYSRREMRIRPATNGDVRVIAASNRAIARETEDLVLDEEIVEHAVAEVIADRMRGWYVLAETDRVIGQLLVTREWSDWRNGWYWWIQSVYVAPETRRQGVYRALHEHVIAEARAAGALAVKLYVDHDNERARATYRSLGMKQARYEIFELDFSAGHPSST
jgi:ribosomal protein S18 acetylase RimI-like enzyme